MVFFRVHQILFVIGFLAISTHSQEFTDKCDETELSMKERESDTCILKKEIELANALSNSESDTALVVCQNIREELECLNNFFESCYDEEILTKVRLNFLNDQAKIALNSTQLLGKSFLQECDLFSSFQKEYILEITGENKCSYIDFVTVIIPRKKACDVKVDREWEQKIKLSSLFSGASARQYLINIACEAYKDFTITCRQSITDQCFSQEKTQKLIDRDYKNVYSEHEAIIQSIDPSFTFESTCSNLQIDYEDFEVDINVPSRSSISKRSASYFKSAKDYLYSDDF